MISMNGNSFDYYLVSFVLMAFLSMFTCLIISISIFYNKKLRNTHPSMLLALISLSEFGMCYNALVWQLGIVKCSCYFGNSQILLYSLKPLYYLFG